MKLEAVDFPGGNADYRELVEAHGSEQCVRDKADCDVNSVKFPAFLEWTNTVVGQVLAEVEADPECIGDTLSSLIVAAFSFGYDWRQIVERRRAVERN